MTVKERNGKWIVDTIWPDKKRTRRQAVTERQAKDLDLRIRASRKDGTMKKLRDLWIVFSECGGPYPTAEYSLRTREGARRLKRDCDRRFPHNKHYVKRYTLKEPA